LEILLQVVLILINAFFAATELAVVSLNSTKLRKLEEDGNKTASRLLKMVEEPSAFLSTIQVAITLAGYLGSAFAAENFSGDLSDWLYNTLGFQALPLSALNTVSIIIITIILSYFTLVFGELVPKRIAMQKSYEVAKLACGVIRVMAFVLRPVIWLLSVSVNAVLRLLRLKVEAEEESVTEDEIRMMVDLGGERGAIDEDEQEWIQNVFDFGDISVREAMTPRSDVDALPCDADDQEILEMIRECGRSRMPVYQENIDTILGILNARDFLLDRNSGKNTPLKDLLRPAYFAPETIKADNLFKEMQKEKVHIAIVVDEYGGTEGIITMEDLLEEIVGNIYDEFDEPEQPEIVPLGENEWRVTGSTPISSLVDDLDLPLPESDDYDTLGGMIVTRLNAIPKDGEELDLEVNGVALHVEKIQEHRIESVVIRQLVPKAKKQRTSAK
jgi:putative hemolysin